MIEQKYSVYNAIIENASIQKKHGFLILFMGFEREDGWHQGLGGHILYNDHKGDCNYCGKIVHKVLEVSRANQIQESIGKAVRIYANDQDIKKIGHIIHDEWLDIESVRSDVRT